MLHLPRIPELAQRERFIRRVVTEGAVITLADEENASVPSQKYPGRTVQLFWSSPVEAKRWANALSGDGKLQTLTLETFAADILPGMAAAKGLVGADWVADPIEAEIDPADLLLRLKTECLPEFYDRLKAASELYMLARDGQPVIEVARRGRVETNGFAIFTSRVEAEAEAKRESGLHVAADAYGDFVSSTLPWAAERGLHISVQPLFGAGSIDVAAPDLLKRIAA
jgi:hypothetical protein